MASRLSPRNRIAPHYGVALPRSVFHAITTTRSFDAITHPSTCSATLYGQVFQTHTSGRSRSSHSSGCGPYAAGGSVHGATASSTICNFSSVTSVDPTEVPALPEHRPHRDVTDTHRTRQTEASRRYRERHREGVLANLRHYREANAERVPEEVAAHCARLRPDGVRWCPRCARHLPLSCFGADRTKPDRLASVCRDCR